MVVEFFCGALSYADDIILLSPSYRGMQNMLDICDVFAKEHFIQFDAKKSHTLIFKSNCYKYISYAPLYLKGQSIHILKDSQFSIRVKKNIY